MIDIPVSPNFKKMVVKSILAIVLFILIYLFLISAAVGIFLGSVYFCLFFLLKWDVNITASILLSLGILSFAGLLLYFLIKFIFVKDKIDRSHMVEISRNDEPELYKLIEEVVEEVGTKFPKRIYLSHEVNAGVFYDSTFWSMFIPTEKIYTSDWD